MVDTVSPDNAPKDIPGSPGEMPKSALPQREVVEASAVDSSSGRTTEMAAAFLQPLFGSLGGYGESYFPGEIIGGCCPRVPGEEEALVWNAAAEASDSERIHVVYQAKGDKIWYLAVRSSDFGSHAHTWCPFASLLPGMKDAMPPPVCYTHYSDEAAMMMTVTSDGLQIHRGTSSVVRAKAERTARSLGEAPVVELVPDRIDKLTPVLWQSLSLFEARARRILAALSVASALVLAVLAFLVWFFAAMALIAAHTDLADSRQRAEDKTTKLMQSVQALRASPMREQLAKFAALNDGLININGFLDIYQIEKGKLSWKALIPSNITAERIADLGGQTIESNPNGTVIGSAPDKASGGKGRK